jgi:hypothetical protein
MSDKKKRVRHQPNRHHLDHRADRLVAIDSDAADDELLTTREVAQWFGVSEEWLEIGRSKGYGPRYTRLSVHIVRYTRGACREFLRARTYASTADYGEVVA